jgi:hypothetical protein
VALSLRNSEAGLEAVAAACGMTAAVAALCDDAADVSPRRASAAAITSAGGSPDKIGSNKPAVLLGS